MTQTQKALNDSWRSLQSQPIDDCSKRAERLMGYGKFWKSPKSNALPRHGDPQTACQRGDRLVAGLSGGVDSVVMLTCCSARQKPALELAALHVNHQINPAPALRRILPCVCKCMRFR
jgi:hypothetical protein